MSNDPESNIKFVSVVKQYEELYNYNLEKYSNRQSQIKAWQNVANQVKSSAAQCKKRWRLLRVTFLRTLRERKKLSGLSGKKRKPHYLEDAMTFLIPFTKSRCQTGNLDSNDKKWQTESYMPTDNNDSEITFDKCVYNFDDTKSTQDDQEISTNTSLETQLPSKSTDKVPLQAPPTRERRTEHPSTAGDWENAAVQCLTDFSAKYKRKRTESTDEEDSDHLFLKSLLPDMKKLNDAQKRRYKQRILSVYDEIINDPCVPI